ncbi:MAG: hypothetical protein PUC33_01095 [Oscillospiraceae bacterium]|nr:hypothetical protein [Oscillospiraceae bacterium]MDD6147273.1 hypothetical protein [Oscillospiraceae bacterium]
MSNTNESFRKVLDNLSGELEKLGFSAYKNEQGEFLSESEGKTWARYTGDKGVVALCLGDGKLMLFSGSDSENPEDTPTRISVALFGDQVDDKDIRYTVNDFSDTLHEKFGVKSPAVKKAQQQKAQQTVSKTAVKNGSYYDPNTLASRICLVFPELRPIYKENINTYGEFLSEEFFTKYGTPKIIEAIKQNDPQTMKKLFQVLNEIYEDGTNDTQSLIAVTILGELNNDQILLARCVDYMSETMAPPVIEVNRYLATASGKRAKKKLLDPPAYKPKKKKKQGGLMQSLMGGMQPPVQ